MVPGPITPECESLAAVLLAAQGAEGALRESLVRAAETAERLLNQVPVPLAVALDAQASRTFGNAAFLRLFGMAAQMRCFSAEQERAHDGYRISRDGVSIPREELPLYRAAIQGVEVHNEQCDIQFDDGRNISVVISATPLLDEQQHTCGAIGVLVDISFQVQLEREQKRIARALSCSENRLRRALEAARMVTWVWDVETDEVIQSDNYQEVLGLEQPLKTGQAYFARVHPQDRGRFLARLRKSVARASQYRLRYRFVRPDGDTIWLEDTADAIREEHGRVRKMTGVIRDVTLEHEAQEQLARSQERLALALQASRLETWDWDLTSGQLYWSSGVYRLMGYVRGEFAPTFEHWAQRVHPEDQARVMEELETARDSHTAYASEHRILRADNDETVWLKALGRFYYDKEGKPLRAVGVVSDITEQRRIEESLKEADRRKDEFMALLGHELRNPLAGIVAGVQVLEMALPPDDENRETLEIIDRQTKQMQHLIDDLLDVSRITRGKVVLRKERVDFRELTARVVEDHRTRFKRAQRTLRLETPERPLWVDGDSTRLAQIVTNLVQNAFNFTEPGGTVEVLLRVRDEATAELQVRDDGLGMTTETLNTLFRPFQQADRSLGRSRGGLGLGLALVKGLVELHNGKVEAHSEGLGRGSQFTVRLPLAASPMPRTSTAAQPSSTPQRRVLIIDDRPDTLVVLSRLLRLGGHEVVTAAGGEAGLELAHQFQPDVILCDIGLPGGMDGYQLAATLRADPQFQSVYLVALTGYGQERDRRRAQLSGFDFHLTKPVGVDALEKLLQDYPRFDPA